MLLKLLNDSFFDRNVDEFFDSYRAMLPPSSSWTPHEGGVKLTVPTPGFEKDDLKVEVTGRFVKVTGNVRNSSELYSDSKVLSKTIQIPSNVKVDTLKCSYRAGVLLLTGELNDNVVPITKELKID